MRNERWAPAHGDGTHGTPMMFMPIDHSRPRPEARGVSHNDAARQTGVSGVLYWALLFLVIAIIAGVFGFGGISAAAAGIAKILFFIFLVVFIVMLIMHIVQGRRPRI